MHADAASVWGGGFSDYTLSPQLDGDALVWQPVIAESLDKAVLAAIDSPFDTEGGLRALSGNLGRAMIKVSAVAVDQRRVSAPAIVIDSQHKLKALLDAGKLDRDCVVVVRFQGPRANGMPELHKLTPLLGLQQDKGYRVALVTDGRMSGASGKVPAAIHVCPEAAEGGPLSKVRDGDVITLDAVAGRLHCEVSAQEWEIRPQAAFDDDCAGGVGRELFAIYRRVVSRADQGASALFDYDR